MSGRDNGHGGESMRTWLQGVLVVVVIAAALGVFGSQSSFERPVLGPLNIAGIVIMFVGLAAAILSVPISEKIAPEKTGPAALAFRLGGVLVCGVGAIMVFL